MMDVSRINEKQPTPTKNQFPAVWDLVYADIIERDKKGEEKYGTRLQAFNGRRTLIDAYQEALDLVVYLRQAIFERDYNETKKKFDKKFDRHEPDSLMCNCPVCKNLWKAIDREEVAIAFIDSYCNCQRVEGIYRDGEGVLWCRDCERKIKESVETKYCSCPGAVEIYLAADDLFRCRNCEKQIAKASDK